VTDEKTPATPEKKQPTPQEVAQQIQVNAIMEELSGQIGMHSRRAAEMAAAMAMQNAELQGLRAAYEDLQKSSEADKGEITKLRAELVKANGVDSSEASPS
jgi:cell division protein FtsB